MAGTEKTRTRLAHLATLGRGWKDGEGLPVAGRAVDAAERLVALRPEPAGSSRIYPTLEGGIQFELEAGGWSLSLEFAPDGSAEIAGTRDDGSSEFGPIGSSSMDDGFLRMLDEAVAGRSPEPDAGDR